MACLAFSIYLITPRPIMAARIAIMAMIRMISTRVKPLSSCFFSQLSIFPSLYSSNTVMRSQILHKIFLIYFQIVRLIYNLFSIFIFCSYFVQIIFAKSSQCKIQKCTIFFVHFFGENIGGINLYLTVRVSSNPYLHQ